MSADNERFLISSLMHDARDVQRSVSEGLTQNDFSSELTKETFRAICRIAARKEPPSVEAVYLEIPNGLKPSGAEILWLSSEPTSTRRKTLTASVMGAARQRRLIAALSMALEVAKADSPSWDDTWEIVVPHLQAARDCSTGNLKRTKEEVLEEAAKILGPLKNQGMPGPFPKWDDQARKLGNGELCVVAARPGFGKSALALQYATACIKTGKECAFFSLEMSSEELYARLAIQAVRSNEQKLTIPQLKTLGALPYQIYETRDAKSVAQIESRARLAASTGNLGLIVIDYLQLVEPPQETKNGNRERQVAEMSRRFKLLAQELKIPVMLLAQLNRESEKDNRRPRLSDLRESGAIEQDADAVWFIHEPSDSSNHSENNNIELHLIQAKRRNWTPNIFTKLVFQRPILTFNPLG